MPTNEQIFSMYEVRPLDWDDASATPIEMEATVGAKKTLFLNFPAAPLYFGFRPTELFQYHTLTTLGVLALYRYPAGVAADKVLLAEVTLEDAAVVNELYMVKVVNVPAAGTSQGHAMAPIADCVPGDQLVAYIKTQGVGDSYILGEFQPVLFVQYRGEGFVKQPAWHERTPVSTGIASAT